MTTRGFVKGVLLAEAFAVTTFGFGWWSVPIVAAIWAIASHDAHRARIAAVCAAAGWLTLLLLDVARGQVMTMGNQLGAVMNLPAVFLYLVTLLFPALLAWSAAALIALRARPASSS